MKSSVLIINHQEPHKVELGADFISSFKEAKVYDYAVVALPISDINSAIEFAHKANNCSNNTQFIISKDHLSAQDLSSFSQVCSARFFVCDFYSTQFDTVVKMALERYHNLEQETTYSRLTQNQNNKLKNISTELADKLSAREKKLIRSQKRIHKINLHFQVLQKSLTAIHAAQSVTEIETLLYSGLKGLLDLNWVRIFLHSADHLDNQLNLITDQTLFKENLQLGSRSIGRAVFARNNLRSFNKDEEELLQQVSESVSLAIDRLAKFDQSETLKQQWESTFDAISEPLCLTDENFNVIKTNKTFLLASNKKLNQVVGHNCFYSFCGDQNPSQITPSPHSIILQKVHHKNEDPQFFDVTTQRIQVNMSSPPILLVLFRNITEQKKIEKQIFESAKMAELGTIGSSIAHDINNPLGGMLSFLQLIKMDLNPDDPIYADITSMESAGHRCKEIVENLLNFSRQHDSKSTDSIRLTDVIQQSLKIMELQTRSLGVSVELEISNADSFITGHFNLLSQALNHILQNAFDAVSERLLAEPGYKGHIKIQLESSTKGLEITINDNGVGINPEFQNKILNPLFSTKNKNKYQGLGLTLAYQIIDSHGGRLDIFSQPNVGTTVKISFINV